MPATRSGRAPSRSGRAASACGAASSSASSPGASIVRLSGQERRQILDAVAPGLLLAQGDRPDRQLVEPGALRQADVAAVGPRDRPDAPAAALPRQRDVPPDVPLRAALGPGGVGVLLIVDRRFRFRPPALFALYVSLVHVRPHVRGAAARRPVAPFLGLRLNAWVSLVVFVRLDGLLLLVAVRRRRRGRGCARAARGRQAEAKRPAMAIPKGRVRVRAASVTVRRWSCASSSWISTPSKGRSTCC